MAGAEMLTLASVLNLPLNPSGAYLLAFSLLFGMSVWVTFFGGVIAFKVLPRQQFVQLQHKIFPVYFLLSAGLSGALLLRWMTSHPNVLIHITQPCIAEVTQAYALGIVLLLHVINYAVLGPLTSRTVFARLRLEKEGDHIREETSDSMEVLNRRFGLLHGMSSMCNMAALIATTFHGLWIGSR